MYTFKNTIFFILLKNELFLYIQENVDTNTVFDLTCHHIKTKVGQFFFIATLGQLLQIRKRFLQIRFTNYSMTHSLKSVRIRSYSGPYFPALRLDTERCGVSLRIQSENTDQNNSEYGRFTCSDYFYHGWVGRKFSEEKT